MDWCAGTYKECNHAPVVEVEVIGEESPAPGDRIGLNAAASYDPDGDELSFRWEIYREAGIYQGEVQICGGNTPEAELRLPADSGGHTLHILLSVTDKGMPPLTTYKRTVISVR